MTNAVRRCGAIGLTSGTERVCRRIAISAAGLVIRNEDAASNQGNTFQPDIDKCSMSRKPEFPENTLVNARQQESQDELKKQPSQNSLVTSARMKIIQYAGSIRKNRKKQWIDT